MPKTKKNSYAKRLANTKARKLFKTNGNDTTENNVSNKDNHADNHNNKTKKSEYQNKLDTQHTEIGKLIDNTKNIPTSIVRTVHMVDTNVSECIINPASELNDLCINAFLKVLTENTSFKPQDPIFYQNPQWYRPVETSQADIQILYGGSIGANAIGHWTCIYREGSVVHVYDTLHRQLSPQQHVILQKLYKHYSVLYEHVPMQPDSTSCGVLAIAIATSLALGKNPTTESYLPTDRICRETTQNLRYHLLNILETQVLIPFPTFEVQELRINNQQQNNSRRDLRTIVGKSNMIGAPKTKIQSKSKRTQSYESMHQIQPQAHIDIDQDPIVETSNIKCKEETVSQLTSWQLVESKKKRKNKKYWNSHKEEINRKRKNIYHVNPTIQRTIVQNRYVIDSIPIKKQKREQYAKNPEPKKLYEKTKYSQNPQNKKTIEKNKYTLNPESKRAYQRAKYIANPEIKKMWSAKFSNTIEEKKASYRKLNVCSHISKKYKLIRIQGNTMKFFGSVDRCINILTVEIDKNLQSMTKSRIEAAKIVKWNTYIRKRLVVGMQKTLANLKRNIGVNLIKAAECPDLRNKIISICGESKHTGSSEAYFVDTAYHSLADIKKNALITTAIGSIANLLPVCPSQNDRKSWICSDLCKEINPYIIDRIEEVLKSISNWKVSNIRNNIRNINNCCIRNSITKLGHSQSCYTNPSICQSKLLPLLIIQAHFPRIRYFVRQIYGLKTAIDKITIIDNALNQGNLKVLKEVSTIAINNALTYQPRVDQINLNEDQIVKQYSQAFEVLTKRSMDVPEFACLSCDKLCCRRNVTNIEKLRKPLSGSNWLNLQIDNEASGNNSTVICYYCIEKFRAHKLPPTCKLNQLEVTARPTTLVTLNDYEKILIQPAKAFQTVQRIGTVTKKNLLHKFKVQKVKGRTFHLPLPLEETWKKLSSPTAPINLNHELYILVCGIPNKANVVWSRLVDVKKIHETSVWLKENNPFYLEIKLPKNHELLLQPVIDEVEIQIEADESQLSDLEAIESNDKTNVSKPPAILTQVLDSEQYYEHFTIHPIHEDRSNKTASALYQMLEIQDAPLNNWDKTLDLMCFPDLYPYGTNCQHQERTVYLRECDFIKSRLMSKHPQFRLNQQYLFYLLNDSNIRQLRSGIFHKLNIMNPRDKLNAASCLEMMSEEQLEGNLSTIFARLRNTEQYWRKARNDVHCMVQNYGTATWFLTISPSEWMWENMAEYIRKINGPEMAKMSTSELVAADPVSTSRYLDNTFQAMLTFICSDNSPIGKVNHYFWRREYQGRGMQHFHMLIWVDEAPIIGKSHINEVANFISKYVTCKIPEETMSPTLHRRVMSYQTHKHNDYCLRNKKKNKGTGYNRVCRFSFPRPVTDSLVIRDVALSIAGRKQLKSKSRLYDIPRSSAEVNINDYNPVILTAWEGNMDIQYVGDTSTALTWYCTSYTTKSESSSHGDIFEDINCTKSLCSRLWSVALRSLNNRECGALEAADTLLGIQLYGTDPDTTIKWLDVNEIRTRKLKSYKTVQTLDPQSTDIFFPSLIDNYYPTRPNELESIHLYDFAKWYEVTKIKPIDKEIEIYELDDGQYLKKRKGGYLINHYRHNINVQPEKYFHTLLLLFKPWRDTDELKGNSESYAEAFEMCKSDLIEALQYHERLTDIQKGFDYMKDMVENKLNDLTCQMSNLSQKDSDNKDNPLGFQPTEADRAMQEINDADQQLENVDVDAMISHLNYDQRRIFNQITSVLSSDNENNILHQFVSGAGGTGKSYLIKTIRSWTKQYLGKTTAVAAPTGLAAFNVDGLTIHRLFQLPIEHGATPKYRELSDQVLKVLRNELSNVVLFIIDEVSMISNITLAYIHMRLSEIFDTKSTNEGWFGKKHIILLGDLLQLPPVNDQSAFLKLTREKVQKCVGSLGTVNLWSHLFTYDELTANMRQQNDPSYKDTLNRIRLGILTDEDLKILESRKHIFQNNSADGRLREVRDFILKLPQDTVCLFSTRNQCENLNTAMLERIPGERIELHSEDTVDCVAYLKKKINKLLNKENEDSSRTTGLAKTIVIKIGAKVMIRRNIDVSLGIINGTIGHITSVSKSMGTNKVESMKIILSSGQECVIERVSTKFEVMDGAYIFRKQFPLSLSYGITIHKCQGLSLTNAVLDIGNSVFTSGQAYVALSRVTHLEGLHLINLDPQSIKVQESALLEYNRLRKLYRPDLPTIVVSKKHKSKVQDTTWSIPKHIRDIQTIIESTPAHAFITNVVGLTNDDNVSCYANVVIQCMFHSGNIIQELVKEDDNNPLSALAQSYCSNSSKLNTLIVREFVDQRFAEEAQQDAAEFLLMLASKSEIISNTIKHQLQITIRCNDCGDVSKTAQQNYILTIPINISSNGKSPTNLPDLVRASLSQWTRLESVCESCSKTNKLQKMDIIAGNQYIVLQLLLFSYNNNQATKITNYKINAVPTAKILINGYTYKVDSAIFHHGTTLDSGHYTAMLKNKSNGWLNTNDMQIRKIIWPRGAKDAYMFILKKF